MSTVLSLLGFHAFPGLPESSESDAATTMFKNFEENLRLSILF
jgi:hypothetical protein